MSDFRTDNSADETAESGALTVPDELIALAYSYHFTWGYPDYMREALKLVTESGGICETLGIADCTRDLTYRQLRTIIEEADSSKTRCMIAGNPDTPASVLNFLATDKDVEVLRRVAENTNSHASTLARLSVHEDEGVRMGVSENANSPELVLLALVNDPSLDVRYALAENIHAPTSVFELLTLDENPYVAARAARTIKARHPAEVVTPDFSRVARRRIGRAAGRSML